MKLTVVLLSITMLLLFFPAGLEASNGIILAVSSAEGQAGDQVVVSVSAENAAGSEGGQFLLLFDPDIIQPVTLETGEMITDTNDSLHMSNLEYQDGELIFMWVTPEADTVDSGIICDITFNLIKDGTTALNLDEVILVPDDVQLASLEPGKVVVGDLEVDRNEDDASGNNDASEDDSKGDEDQVPDEQASEPIDNADEEAALSTGATRTNTLLYTALFIAAVLVVGLFVLLKKTKKKGNLKAGR